VARRIASPVDWLTAHDWLTVEEACRLSGWDRETMIEIANAGGVDLDDAGHIAKDSLWEFQESCALVAHWNELCPMTSPQPSGSQQQRRQS
jgi:hypothetical protein